MARDSSAPKNADEPRIAVHALVVSSVLFLLIVIAEAFLGYETPSLDTVFAVSWLVIIAAVYLDARGVRGGRFDWNPRAGLWALGCIVPLVNVSTVIAYLARRYERVSMRTSWDFWWRIAGVSVAVVAVPLVTEVAVAEYLSVGATVLTDLTAYSVLFTSVLVPVAVRYDMDYAQKEFGWSPDRKLWLIGSAIWFLNILVVFAYVSKRNPESSDTVSETDGDDDVPWGSMSKDPAKEIEDDATSEIDSDWWYLPLSTVVLTVLLAAIGFYYLRGYEAGTAGDLPLFQLLELLILLVLLSYISLYAIYRDGKVIRESGHDWRPSYEAYVLAALVISPLVPSFVYVLQRLRYVGRG